ncbi:hypothetical protein EIP86_000704 [Pleurotus ostreatoroseus]|nr:hypothetical protein EIP86_000704 [Pleurotus ostreatoroseus]
MADDRASKGIVYKRRQCQRCYVLEIEKPLMVCSQCKVVRYCSRECQKKDWKSHKLQCQSNANLSAALLANASSPAGRAASRLLPDDLSLHALDALLEDWVRAHSRTLMLACLHAVRLADAFDNIHTKVLVVRVRPLPRAVHGGDAARAFAVEDAYPLDADEGARRDSAWAQSVEHLRTVQSRAEKMGRGRTGATMIECDPLAVQVEEDWKDILVEDLREGRKVSRLPFPTPDFQGRES